jgi:hypothetical protein
MAPWRSETAGPLRVLRCNEAAKEGRQAIKRWRLHRWSEVTLTDVARSINGIVRGWANYYGRFYPSEFARSLRRINDYLVRWAMWKYKRLRRHPARAWQLLASVARREPDLVAHWRLGLRPDGWGRWEPGELRGSRRVLRAPRCLRSDEGRKHIRWTLSIVTIL